VHVALHNAIPATRRCCLIFRRLAATAVVLLGTLASAQAVDPLPYDSIATSYSKRMNDNNMQKDADIANLVPNRVRVNQAGYRLQDVEQGFANFYYVASGTAVPFFSVLNDDGSVVKSGLALFSKGVTVKGQINPYASNSATLKNNGVGDWKKGYPMTGTQVSGNLLEGVLPDQGRYGYFGPFHRLPECVRHGARRDHQVLRDQPKRGRFLLVP
jgi:hypothetical protein